MTAVSVVVPLFDNAATVAELCRRVHAALDPAPHEVLLVVDACPRGSREAAEAARARDPRVHVLALSRRSGQHEAALAGMAQARGEWVVVMDGDLQDPPEAIPALLAADGEKDAVFAARQGRYQGLGRRLTAHAFRAVLSGLTGLPRQVGMFFAVRREVAARVLARPVAHPYLVAMVAHAARAVATVPVTRQVRPSGRSAYSALGRVRVALRALLCVRELRSAQAPRTARRAWIAPSAVAVVAGTFYAAQVSRFPFGVTDEGYLFAIADAVNHGRVLYREVELRLYPPELFHAFALVLRESGRSIVAARLVMAAFLAASVVLTYLVARRFTGPLWTAAVTALVLVVPGPWHKFYVAFFFLLVLLCALRALEDGRAARYAALGAAVGGCLYFRLDAFAVGALLGAVVVGWRSPRASLRPLAFFAAGLAGAGALLVLLLWRQGILGPFAQQLASFPATVAARASASYRLPPPPLADLGRRTAAGAYAAVFYGSFLAPVALAAAVLARRGRAGVVLLLWALGHVPQYAVERPDLSHLSQHLPALALAAVAARGRVPGAGGGRARAVRAGLGLALAAYLGLYVALAVRLGAGGAIVGPRIPVRTVTLSNGQRFVQQDDAVADVVEYVLRHTAPHEPVATLPYVPGINFLAERPMPGRQVYVLPSQEEAVQDEYAADLERSGTRYVVFLEGIRFNLRDDTDFDRYAPRLAAYLASRYEEVFRRASLVVLRRRGAWARPPAEARRAMSP